MTNDEIRNADRGKCLFVICYSGLIRHSSFVIRPSSFVIRHSSFVIRISSET